MRTQEIREMEKRAEMYRRLLIWNIVFLLGLLCWGSVRGQGEIKWQKAIGGNKFDQARSIDKLNNGYIIGGISMSDSSFDKTKNSRNNTLDYWIVKLDVNGNKIWDKTYGSNSDDFLWTCKTTKNNGILVAGYTTGDQNGDKSDSRKGGPFDLWILLLDSNGNKIWDKTLGGIGYDIISGDIVETNSGFILSAVSTSGISGNKTSLNKGGKDIWLIKLDLNGNIIWDKTYGSIGEEAVSCLAKIDENSFIIGSYNNSDSSYDKSRKVIGATIGNDYWILNIDSNGIKKWDNVYGSHGNDELSDIEIIDNQIILAGSTSNNNGGFDITEKHRGDTTVSDIWIQSIDFNGNKLWDKTLGGSWDERLPHIAVKGDKILITCLSSSDSGFDKSERRRGSSDYWVIYLTSNGKKLWDKTIGTSEPQPLMMISSLATESNTILIPGTAKLNDNDKFIPGKGEEDYWLVNLKIPNKVIKGSVFPDFNSNCLYNKPSEFNFPNVLVHNKTENTYTITNDSIYTMYLFDRDTAILKIINLDSNLYVACGKDSILIDMTGKTDTSGIDFPIRSNKTGHCINITSFSSGLLRPGRWGDYQLNYQNNAFDTAYNGYIEIEVDTATIDSIKSPYSFTLTGTILRFNLGHVRPFGFSSVTYSIKLKTTVIIGSSHCHRAKVFPICNLYPSTVYDSSEIQPMMRCLPNDTIEFSLKNIGTKDQKDWGLVKSYEDIIIFKVDSFRLNKGDIRIWKYKLDTNKVYTAEVFNSNFHPVTPILIRHDDLCANRRPMIPQNAALNFSRHDEAKEYEEACTIVRGSYDPNIKSVQPVGMFAEHYTSTGTELKYRIDFQNTGTDTAFRVVLVDTLSSFLDIASFLPGVSSHPYTLEFGGRAVKFIFEPISLIDSGTNEPASHGYVHFKIKHIAGISPKSKIENKADIYFDYNAPIRTNTVFNTIFDTIQIYVPKGGSAIAENDKTSVIVFPNPTTDKFFIQMSEPVMYLSIEIYDMQGRLIKTAFSPNNETVEVSAQGMTKGIYHIRCMSGDKVMVVKKVMVE